MKLTKILKELWPAWAVGGILSVSLGIFNLAYNYTQSDESSLSLSRTEAPFIARSFHRKTFTPESSMEIASRYVFMDTRTFYSDYQGKDPNSQQPDGFVDKISRHGILTGPKGEWIRERDYLGNEKRFAEADKYLADTKAKFNDILN